MLTEILIIFLLFLANGAFSMAEMAVVSSSKARLRVLVEEGHAGARAALDLAENPNRLLSAVQIGITLITTLAGAYGGATIADELASTSAPFRLFPLTAAAWPWSRSSCSSPSSAW